MKYEDFCFFNICRRFSFSLDFSGHFLLRCGRLFIDRHLFDGIDFSRSCSDLNCSNTGECIDSVAGAVCNCTAAFAGLYCQICKLKDAIFNYV